MSSSGDLVGVMGSFRLMIPIFLAVESHERFLALWRAVRREAEAEQRAEMLARIAGALRARADQVARAEAIYWGTR